MLQLKAEPRVATSLLPGIGHKLFTSLTGWSGRIVRRADSAAWHRLRYTATRLLQPLCQHAPDTPVNI
jgi:hypothetical protein